MGGEKRGRSRVAALYETVPGTVILPKQLGTINRA